MRVQDYIKKLSKLELLSVIESSRYLKDNQDELDKFISEIKPLPVAIVRKQFLEIEILKNYIEEVLLPNYLDEYYSNITNEEIVALCKIYSIINYTINDDKTIDVNGHVFFGANIHAWKKFKRIPIRFNKVSGDFVYESNMLNSFIGFPKEIRGFSRVSGNFESLENFPIVNTSNLIIKSDSLKTLKGLQGELKGLCILSSSLNSFDGLPKNIRSLELYCKNLTLLEGLHDNVSYIEAYNTPVDFILSYFKDNLEFLLYSTFIEESDNGKPNLYYKLYVEKLKYIGKCEPDSYVLSNLERHYNIVY